MPNYASVVTLCDNININNKTIWQNLDNKTKIEWIGCMPNYASVVTLCDSININNKTIWQDFRQDKEDGNGSDACQIMHLLSPSVTA